MINTTPIKCIYNSQILFGIARYQKTDLQTHSVDVRSNTTPEVVESNSVQTEVSEDSGNNTTTTSAQDEPETPEEPEEDADKTEETSEEETDGKCILEVSKLAQYAALTRAGVTTPRTVAAVGHPRRDPSFRTSVSSNADHHASV